MLLREWIGRFDFKSPPVMWGLLGVIIILGLVIRVALSDISLWVDEGASVLFGRVPFKLLWSEWMARETNPPLYYSFLKIWMILFGESAFALRSLSILAGCAGIFVIFLIGRELGGPVAGLLAALLLAVSFQNVFYSLQVRGYIFTQTFALAAIYAVLRVMRPDEPTLLRRWAMGVYVISVSAAAYCHTILIILPFLINLFLLPWAVKLWPLKRAIVIEWLMAQALVLILWSWWGAITWHQINHATTISWIPHLGLREAVDMTRSTYSPIIQGGKFWALVMVAIIGFMAFKYRANRALILVFVGLAVPTIIFLLNLKTPVMLARTIFWGTGPFIAALAVGICAIPDRRLAAAAAVLAVGIGSYETISLRHANQMEPWRQIVHTLNRIDPKAVVLASEEVQSHLMQRYCAEIQCRLNILAPQTIPFWTQYLRPANQVSLSDVKTLLPTHKVLYVVSRNSKNLNSLVAPYGKSESVTIDGGLPSIIAVTRWTAVNTGVENN